MSYTYRQFYNDTLADATEIFDEVEKHGGDTQRLLDERAYSRGVETYFCKAFEIVDAMRGDGHLFDDAADKAEELYGTLDFRDMVYKIAEQGYLLQMLEHYSRFVSVEEVTA
jgi:hypothetical protein